MLKMSSFCVVCVVPEYIYIHQQGFYLLFFVSLNLVICSFLKVVKCVLSFVASIWASTRSWWVVVSQLWVVWHYILAWFGAPWCGIICWYGVVWCGLVYCGVLSKHCFGAPWCGIICWYGVVWCGLVWCIVVCFQSTALVHHGVVLYAGLPSGSPGFMERTLPGKDYRGEGCQVYNA